MHRNRLSVQRLVTLILPIPTTNQDESNPLARTSGGRSPFPSAPLVVLVGL
ncbi:MAG: hypothetical protein AAGA75_02125 [Cyanobacteria bacterium P01_E01_bin.6]